MDSIKNKNFYDFYRPEEYLFHNVNRGYWKYETGECGIEGALIEGLLEFQERLDADGVPAANFLLQYDCRDKNENTIEAFVEIACIDKETLDKVLNVKIEDYIDAFRMQMMCPWTSAKDIFVYAMPEDLVNPVFDNNKNILTKEDGTPIDGWTCKVFAVAENMEVFGKMKNFDAVRFKYDLTLKAEEVTEGIHQDLHLTLHQYY